MKKVRLVTRPDHPSFPGTGWSSHPAATGGSTFWRSYFPGRYFRFPAGVETPGPGFEEWILSAPAAELAAGKWSLELVFSELLRLGARPGRVSGLAALAPEAAKWLLKNLTDAENDLRQRVILDAESYAAAVRSAIARATARTVLADIESEQK